MAEMLQSKRNGVTHEDLARLNVGGKRFLTSWSTLLNLGSQSFFSGLRRYQSVGEQICDDKGYIFIDRNPLYFEPLLDYLRTGRLECPPNLNMDRLLSEAEFYGLHVESCPSESLSDRMVRMLMRNRFEKRLGTETEKNTEVVSKLKAVIFQSILQLIQNDEPLEVQFWPSISTLLASAEPLLRKRPSETNPADLEMRLNQILSETSSYVKNDELWNGLNKVKHILVDVLRTEHSLSVSLEVCNLHVCILRNGGWYLSRTRPQGDVRGHAQFEGFKISWQGDDSASNLIYSSKR